VCRRGRDNAPGHNRDAAIYRKEHMGHTTSEWVIVARKREDLDGDPNNPDDKRALKVPADYNDLRREVNNKLRQMGRAEGGEPYWSTPPTTGRYVWTDDYSNLLAVFRPFMKPIE
jgi:hypothetical protein